jgi:hypothetical protein
MALFTFDYGQLDANLKSDEQGLWNTIKTRYEKDKNFEVYFLINKIDMAMEDNFKEVKNIDDAKKQWGIHEKKAIEKLKKASKDNGIDNPKIYTIASKFALLDRNDTDWDSPLESFQKKFKNIFSDIWENEYIKYIGIVELENDINQYINTSVRNKILKIALDNISTTKNEELISLTSRIQTLSKPKEEATKNVNKALKFLEVEAMQLEMDMNNKFQKESNKTVEKIIDSIDSAIQNELYSKVDEIAKIAIAYAQEIANDEKHEIAIKMAKRGYKDISLDKILEIPLIDLFNQEIISYELTERPVFNQVVMMLKKAFKKIPNNTNLTLHSDQGWQYQMKQYQYLLKEKGIIQSMSRKGNCLDNAIIENFFGTLKSELFYIKKFRTIEELKNEIKQYIDYYNNDRIKSNLNKMSPIKYRAHYYQN